MKVISLVCNIRKLDITSVEASPSATLKALHDVFVRVENSAEEIGTTQVKNWLKHCKKKLRENLIESALGGTDQ